MFKSAFFRKFYLSTALGVAMVFSSPASHAQKFEYPVIDLSLNSAILFALHKNPTVEIFLERYSQAKSTADDVKAALYPEISTSVEIGHEYNNPSSTNQKSAVNDYAEMTLSLEQILFDGFETRHNIKRQKDLSQAAYWAAQNEVENILRETARFYLDILRYQQEVQINEDLMADIQSNLNFINDQYEAGAADKVILDYANSRLAFASTQLNRAQSSLNDAVSNLEFLTGKLPPKFKTSYPEKLSPDKLDLQYYLDRAEEGNSSLIARDYQKAAAEHQLAAQRGRDLPAVNLVLDVEQTHNSGGEQGINRSAQAFVRIDYTLFDGSKRKSVKNRMKSEINEAAIRKEQTLKEIRRDLKQAYNIIQSNFESIQATEFEISSSEALKALNEENFKLGNINIIELIESAERLSQAKVKKVTLTNDMYLNTYNLLILSSMIGQEFFCATCDPS